MLGRTLGPEGGGFGGVSHQLEKETSASEDEIPHRLGEENETPFIRCGNLSLILKTLRGSPKGKGSKGQYPWVWAFTNHPFG